MSEKSLSLALEVSKRAKSKKSFGADDVRKARLHDLLFDISSSADPSLDSLDTEAPLEASEMEVEEPQEETPPTRKERLLSILNAFDAKSIKKTDDST